MAETKLCRVCGEELPATADYFYKKPSGKDGLDPRCICCVLVITSLKYHENRDHRLSHQSAKDYLEAH